MARVMKKGAGLAVMTFVKRRFLRFKRVHEHLRKEHGGQISDVEELDSYLSKTGFKDFTYDIYGSMINFHARKR